MKKIRKYGFLLIVFAILLLVSKVETKAATIVKEGSCGEKATYTLDSDGVLTISGSGEIRSEVFSGYGEFGGWDEILEFEKVIIKEGITSIEGEAFAGCSKMKTVTIPDSVKTIGGGAISNHYLGWSDRVYGYYDDEEGAFLVFSNDPELTIYGTKGSAAETYAKENGITFKEVSNKKSSTKKLTSKNTTIKLSKTAYTYNGKAKKPTVKVYNSAGKLLKNKFYSLSYKDNKNPGKATVIIKFKNGYSGTIKKTFTINPASTKISNVAVKLTWAKQKQITGYQIQYATNNKFTKNKKSEIVNGSDKNYLTVKMEKGNTYYYRVRTYKTVNGKKYYSSWSKTTSVEVK